METGNQMDPSVTGPRKPHGTYKLKESSKYNLCGWNYNLNSGNHENITIT
jgi:hypothetical protein